MHAGSRVRGYATGPTDGAVSRVPGIVLEHPGGVPVATSRRSVSILHNALPSWIGFLRCVPLKKETDARKRSGSNEGEQCSDETLFTSVSTLVGPAQTPSHAESRNAGAQSGSQKPRGPFRHRPLMTSFTRRLQPSSEKRSLRVSGRRAERTRQVRSRALAIPAAAV